MALLAAMLLAACSDEPQAAIVIAPERDQAKPIVAASPINAPTPRATALAREAFVDPPLPPELVDDGGLVPLPTPSSSGE